MLLFARHGNTFEKGEVPRIVGANEDLPLTAEGKDQARGLGRALKLAGIRLSCIHAGPLVRTMEFAQIVAGECGFADEIARDLRLRELDYGHWAGLTDAEVADQYGQTALDGWRLEGVRPSSSEWSPSEASVRSSLACLARELGENSLCVTSNGILRYVMELDPTAFASNRRNGGFRVKTGNICAFNRTAEGLKLAAWNECPDADRLARIAVTEPLP
jgi:broad specificity phosphatase PhoE